MLYADIPFESAIVHATRSPARLLGLDARWARSRPAGAPISAIWNAEYQPSRRSSAVPSFTAPRTSTGRPARAPSRREAAGSLGWAIAAATIVCVAVRPSAALQAAGRGTEVYLFLIGMMGWPRTPS